MPYLINLSETTGSLRVNYLGVIEILKFVHNQLPVIPFMTIVGAYASFFLPTKEID